MNIARGLLAAAFLAGCSQQKELDYASGPCPTFPPPIIWTPECPGTVEYWRAAGGATPPPTIERDCRHSLCPE
jgi:hypothetical protein